MKRYDWTWVGKVSVYGLATLGLIYFGICTACVWFDAVQPWNIWEIIAK